MNVLTAGVSELADALKAKTISSKEIVQEYKTQIEKWDAQINAFISLNPLAEKIAEASDEDRSKGSSCGPLAGIPVAIKDLLCTTGLQTTAGSKILEGFVPPYSATVVERLESAGAIVIGKTNLDEFAMGSSTETSYFGPCKNPWNLDCVAGGSSGGSAAAVAAGMAPLAIGTDTGGSIRQPASFCGIVGVKPTYGRVSRYGVVAFASSLDQVGPMTRSVQDSALMLEVISGHDPMDSTTAKQSVPEWSKNLKQQLTGVRVGLPKEYFTDATQPEVMAAVERAIEIVKSSGAEIVEVSLPNTEYAVPIYYLIATSEASSNLARYDGVRFGHRADFSDMPAKDLEDFYCRSRGEGFGSEVKRRIVLGTYSLSSGYYDAYYKKACQVRRVLQQDFMHAFTRCDVLLSPVTTSPAFKMGERIEDPLAMYTNDIFTTSTNLAGLPGMSVPAGFTSAGLPVGVQLTASPFEEQNMLNVAYAIEQSLNLKEQVPDVLR
ncbi:MAG: Asp-tRNA(Asn)/Glu-tRNA(Gln) amidotransferase subunit GatA [Pseudobdellovibrionaceae bacterium]|nr:Asp-tRNA(Asn)/Glu-tRNA(Gln) amidotransferase subunit GatA [Bdellovibrionales bacterium]USN46805.1 MAG: Asp-tRNA(Asn)/Glu-tRNA(Gln) amidotransferase subunit GatA [Pseudobdellovibrionaceae bacterium]